MSVELKSLRGSSGLERIVIESVDLSLYIATAVIGGEEQLVMEQPGKPLKTHNLLEMQRRLRKVSECELFLRQRSAYDEMVGQRYAHMDNTMELPLGSQPLPDWLN